MRWGTEWPTDTGSAASPSPAPARADDSRRDGHGEGVISADTGDESFSTRELSSPHSLNALSPNLFRAEQRCAPSMLQWRMPLRLLPASDRVPADRFGYVRRERQRQESLTMRYETATLIIV